jgi:hypothetical protein
VCAEEAPFELGTKKMAPTKNQVPIRSKPQTPRKNKRKTDKNPREEDYEQLGENGRKTTKL